MSPRGEGSGRRYSSRRRKHFDEPNGSRPPTWNLRPRRTGGDHRIACRDIPSVVRNVLDERNRDNRQTKNANEHEWNAAGEPSLPKFVECLPLALRRLRRLGRKLRLRRRVKQLYQKM
jgi:hypothetical protein